MIRIAGHFWEESTDAGGFLSQQSVSMFSYFMVEQRIKVGGVKTPIHPLSVKRPMHFISSVEELSKLFVQWYVGHIKHAKAT